MFNDRDITVIGAGAVLSVMCLLLPVAFPWKIAAGFFTLVSSMVAAFIRLGRDGLTLENWLVRRIRFRLRPRFWTFQVREMQKKTERKPSPPKEKSGKKSGVPPQVDVPMQKIRWRSDSFRVEPLAGILLGVVGLYFLEWLRSGGTAILSFDIGRLLP